MNSMDAGLKCIVCINAALKNKVVGGSAEPVQWAVDGARTAVTTRNGDALCVEHLHERLASRALEDALLMGGK